MSSIIRGVGDAVCDTGKSEVAGIVHRLQGHDLASTRHTRDPNPVVGFRGSDSGTLRTVSVCIDRIRIVGTVIIARYAIVIEVGMIVIHSAVYDCHDRIGLPKALAVIPGLGSVAVKTRSPASRSLAGVVVPPVLIVIGVVGDRLQIGQQF